MTRPSRSITVCELQDCLVGIVRLIPLGYDCSDESDDEHEPARKVSKKNVSPASSSLSSEHNTKHQSSILQLPASVHCLNLDHRPQSL